MNSSWAFVCIKSQINTDQYQTTRLRPLLPCVLRIYLPFRIFARLLVLLTLKNCYGRLDSRLEPGTLSLIRYVHQVIKLFHPSRSNSTIVRSKDDKAVLEEDESYENFHPTFTYPVGPFFRSLPVTAADASRSRSTEKTRNSMDTRT